MKNRWLRSLAFVLTVVFTETTVLGNSFLYAEPVEAPGPLAIFQVPPELGTVEETYFPSPSGNGSTPFIIHIQDAHAHPEAEAKIKDLLVWLDDRQKVSHGQPLQVAVEGAVGAVHPEYLEFFKEFPEANRAVVLDLAAKGELTGAELFAWEQHQSNRQKGDRRESVVGVEKPDLYRENLRTYRDLLFKRGEIELALQPFAAQLEVEKSKILGPELRKFVREKDQRDQNLIPYLALILKTQAKKVLGIDLEDRIEQIRFPHLTRLVFLHELEAKIDQSAVERDWKKLKRKLFKAGAPAGLVEELDSRRDSSSSALEEPVTRTQNDDRGVILQEQKRQLRQVFEEIVRSLSGEGVRFNRYPEFVKWAAFTLLSEEVDSGKLLKEVERLEQAIERGLAKTEAERKLLRTLRDFRLFRRLVLLELSREEYDRILSRQRHFERWQEDARLRSFSGQALQFYSTARERDRLLIENTLALTGSRPVVLITGGFHTGGLTGLMKEKGISYAVISPRISTPGTGDHYQRVMRRENAKLPAHFNDWRLNKQEALLLKALTDQALPTLVQKYGVEPGELPQRMAEAIRQNPVLGGRLETSFFPGKGEPFVRLSSPHLSVGYSVRYGAVDGADRRAVSEALLTGDDYSYLSSSQRGPVDPRFNPMFDLTFTASGRSQIRRAPPETQLTLGNLSVVSGPLTSPPPFSFRSRTEGQFHMPRRAGLNLPYGGLRSEARASKKPGSGSHAPRAVSQEELVKIASQLREQLGKIQAALGPEKSNEFDATLLQKVDHRLGETVKNGRGLGDTKDVEAILDQYGQGDLPVSNALKMLQAIHAKELRSPQGEEAARHEKLLRGGTIEVPVLKQAEQFIDRYLSDHAAAIEGNLFFVTLRWLFHLPLFQWRIFSWLMPMLMPSYTKARGEVLQILGSVEMPAPSTTPTIAQAQRKTEESTPESAATEALAQKPKLIEQLILQTMVLQSLGFHRFRVIGKPGADDHSLLHQMAPDFRPRGKETTKRILPSPEPRSEARWTSSGSADLSLHYEEDAGKVQRAEVRSEAEELDSAKESAPKAKEAKDTYEWPAWKRVTAFGIAVSLLTMIVLGPIAIWEGIEYLIMHTAEQGYGTYQELQEAKRVEGWERILTLPEREERFRRLAESYPDVIPYLYHEYRPYREMAADALISYVRNRPEDTERGDGPDPFDEILPLLDSEKPEIRKLGARILREVGWWSPRSVPRIQKALDEESDPEVQEALLEALGGSVTDEVRVEVVETLIQFLYHENLALVRKAAETLAPLGESAEPAVPRLVWWLKGGEPKTQISALRAFRGMGREASPAVPVIIQLLSHDSPDVRGEAAWTLGQVAAHWPLGIGGFISEETRQLLTGMLREEDYFLRFGGSYVLRFVGARKEAVPALIDLLKEDDFWLVMNALDALGNLGSEAAEAVPFIIPLLSDSDPRSYGAHHRLNAAVDALGNIGAAAKSALGALEELRWFKTRDQNLRNRIDEAMEWIEFPHRARLRYPRSEVRESFELQDIDLTPLGKKNISEIGVNRLVISSIWKRIHDEQDLAWPAKDSTLTVADRFGFIDRSWKVELIRSEGGREAVQIRVFLNKENGTELAASAATTSSEVDHLINQLEADLPLVSLFELVLRYVRKTKEDVFKEILLSDLGDEMLMFKLGRRRKRGLPYDIRSRGWDVVIDRNFVLLAVQQGEKALEEVATELYANSVSTSGVYPSKEFSRLIAGWIKIGRSMAMDLRRVDQLTRHYRNLIAESEAEEERMKEVREESFEWKFGEERGEEEIILHGGGADPTKREQGSTMPQRSPRLKWSSLRSFVNRSFDRPHSEVHEQLSAERGGSLSGSFELSQTLVKSTKFNAKTSEFFSKAAKVLFNTAKSRLDTIQSRLDTIQSRLDTIQSRLKAIKPRFNPIESLLHTFQTISKSSELALDVLKNYRELTFPIVIRTFLKSFHRDVTLTKVRRLVNEYLSQFYMPIYQLSEAALRSEARQDWAAFEFGNPEALRGKLLDYLRAFVDKPIAATIEESYFDEDDDFGLWVVVVGYKLTATDTRSGFPQQVVLVFDRDSEEPVAGIVGHREGLAFRIDYMDWRVDDSSEGGGYLHSALVTLLSERFAPLVTYQRLGTVRLELEEMFQAMEEDNRLSVERVVTSAPKIPGATLPPSFSFKAYLRSEGREQLSAVSFQLSARSIKLAIAFVFGAILSLFAELPNLREVLKKEDRDQLSQIERDTFGGFFELFDPATGWPVDIASVRTGRVRIDYPNPNMVRTSPTNIGLGAIGIVLARDRGHLSEEEARERIERFLTTLEAVEKHKGFLYNWYLLTGAKGKIPQVTLNRFVSSVDNGNLSAALMIVTEAFPNTDIAKRAQAILDGQDYHFFFNQNPKHLHTGMINHGFDTARGRYSDYDYAILNSEARLTALLAILKDNVPRSAWDNQNTTVKVYSAETGKEIPHVAAWSGSIFEGLMADEILAGFRLAPKGWGENSRRLVEIQIDRGGRISKVKVWGFSPGQVPGSGGKYDVAEIPDASHTTFSERFVTPYSVLLSLRYAPKEAVENLNRIRQLNRDVYRPGYGFTDSIDPVTGTVNENILSLDKGMEVLALGNVMAELQAQKGEEAGASRYFWRYLRRIGKEPLGRAIIRGSETLPEFQTEIKTPQERPDVEIEVGRDEAGKVVYSVIKSSTNLGAFYNQGEAFAKEGYRNDPERGRVLVAEYDVSRGGAFSGLYIKLPGEDFSKYRFLNLLIRGDAESVKIELKSGGRLVQVEPAVKVTKEWQAVSLKLNPNLGRVDEMTLVFENARVGGNTKGEVEIAVFEAGTKPQKAVPAEKPGSMAPPAKPDRKKEARAYAEAKRGPEAMARFIQDYLASRDYRVLDVTWLHRVALEMTAKKWGRSRFDDLAIRLKGKRLRQLTRAGVIAGVPPDGSIDLLRYTPASLAGISLPSDTLLASRSEARAVPWGVNVDGNLKWLVENGFEFDKNAEPRPRVVGIAPHSEFIGNGPKRTVSNHTVFKGLTPDFDFPSLFQLSYVQLRSPDLSHEGVGKQFADVMASSGVILQALMRGFHDEQEFGDRQIFPYPYVDTEILDILKFLKGLKKDGEDPEAAARQALQNTLKQVFDEMPKEEDEKFQAMIGSLTPESLVAFRYTSSYGDIREMRSFLNAFQKAAAKKAKKAVVFTLLKPGLEYINYRGEKIPYHDPLLRFLKGEQVLDRTGHPVQPGVPIAFHDLNDPSSPRFYEAKGPGGVTVINLPMDYLNSRTFNQLHAYSDVAVVAGDKGLNNALAFAMEGVGPPTFFDPHPHSLRAMSKQFEAILKARTSEQKGYEEAIREVGKFLQGYFTLQDSALQPLTEEEIKAIEEKMANLMVERPKVYQFVFSQLAKPGNMFNFLIEVIARLEAGDSLKGILAHPPIIPPGFEVLKNRLHLKKMRVVLNVEEWLTGYGDARFMAQLAEVLQAAGAGPEDILFHLADNDLGNLKTALRRLARVTPDVKTLRFLYVAQKEKTHDPVYLVLKWNRPEVLLEEGKGRSEMRQGKARAGLKTTVSRKLTTEEHDGIHPELEKLPEDFPILLVDRHSDASRIYVNDAQQRRKKSWHEIGPRNAGNWLAIAKRDKRVGRVFWLHPGEEAPEALEDTYLDEFEADVVFLSLRRFVRNFPSARQLRKPLIVTVDYDFFSSEGIRLSGKEIARRAKLIVDTLIKKGFRGRKIALLHFTPSRFYLNPATEEEEERIQRLIDPVFDRLLEPSPRSETRAAETLVLGQSTSLQGLHKEVSWASIKNKFSYPTDAPPVPETIPPQSAPSSRAQELVLLIRLGANPVSRDRFQGIRRLLSEAFPASERKLYLPAGVEELRVQLFGRYTEERSFAKLSREFRNKALGAVKREIEARKLKSFSLEVVSAHVEEDGAIVLHLRPHDTLRELREIGRYAFEEALKESDYPQPEEAMDQFRGLVNTEETKRRGTTSYLNVGFITMGRVIPQKDELGHYLTADEIAALRRVEATLNEELRRHRLLIPVQRVSLAEPKHELLKGIEEGPEQEWLIDLAPEPGLDPVQPENAKQFEKVWQQLMDDIRDLSSAVDYRKALFGESDVKTPLRQTMETLVQTVNGERIRVFVTLRERLAKQAEEWESQEIEGMPAWKRLWWAGRARVIIGLIEQAYPHLKTDGRKGTATPEQIFAEMKNRLFMEMGVLKPFHLPEGDGKNYEAAIHAFRTSDQDPGGLEVTTSMQSPPGSGLEGSMLLAASLMRGFLALRAHPDWEAVTVVSPLRVQTSSAGGSDNVLWALLNGMTVMGGAIYIDGQPGVVVRIKRLHNGNFLFHSKDLVQTSEVIGATGSFHLPEKKDEDPLRYLKYALAFAASLPPGQSTDPFAIAVLASVLEGFPQIAVYGGINGLLAILGGFHFLTNEPHSDNPYEPVYQETQGAADLLGRHAWLFDPGFGKQDVMSVLTGQRLSTGVRQEKRGERIARNDNETLHVMRLLQQVTKGMKDQFGVETLPALAVAMRTVLFLTNQAVGEGRTPEPLGSFLERLTDSFAVRVKEKFKEKSEEDIPEEVRSIGINVQGAGPFGFVLMVMAFSELFRKAFEELYAGYKKDLGERGLLKREPRLIRIEPVKRGMVVFRQAWMGEVNGQELVSSQEAFQSFVDGKLGGHQLQLAEGRNRPNVESSVSAAYEEIQSWVEKLGADQPLKLEVSVNGNEVLLRFEVSDRDIPWFSVFAPVTKLKPSPEVVIEMPRSEVRLVDKAVWVVARDLAGGFVPADLKISADEISTWLHDSRLGAQTRLVSTTAPTVVTAIRGVLGRFAQPSTSQAAPVHLVVPIERKQDLGDYQLEAYAGSLAPGIFDSTYRVTFILEGGSTAEATALKEKLQAETSVLGLSEQFGRQIEVVGVSDPRGLVAVISQAAGRFPGYSTGILYSREHASLRKRLGFMKGLVRLRYGQPLNQNVAAFIAAQLLREQLAANPDIFFDPQDLEAWADQFDFQDVNARLGQVIATLRHIATQA